MFLLYAIVKQQIRQSNVAVSESNGGVGTYRTIESPLSRIEGQILVDIINDHGFDQLFHFPTRERNTLDLIITSLPNQFVDIHSPDCLSDHDIVSGTLKIVILPIKKPRRKVYRY